LTANREFKSSVSEDKNEIYHQNMHQGRHNSLWEHYVEHQGVINTDSNLNDTMRTWSSVKLYEDQSQMTVHKHMMDEMNWEKAGAPSAEFLTKPSNSKGPSVGEPSVSTHNEVQGTFDLNSPVAMEPITSIPPVKRSSPHSTVSVHDEFDEPKGSETVVRESSDFNAYLSESQVKDFNKSAVIVATRSGRWATLADFCEGSDGFKSTKLLKPMDGGRPQMRSHSSFEVRNLSSFKMSLV